ncbi:hypothetical protein LZQ00_17645 [Sphingobacterium sp. SRCM116780]|uniref:hypothetical protein n=1 Tax=Sphingobacterium sp. SRCM116780 TaxID=2907623 RepID=UPI001F2321AF|nr:hypothetical protein [Sphingobacterium sp. SRCM116780]UIR56074.1 hypothetical protein LZQ00_17645 [Sphingobacterium sp. SRCM116780]
MSNIKERVLLIAESKGINRMTFFEELGLSYANFKGIQKNSALSSDTVVIILSKYKDINPIWLLIGEGEMYKDAIGTVKDPLLDPYTEIAFSDRGEVTAIDALYKVVSALEQTVRSQEKTIRALEKQIILMENK